MSWLFPQVQNNAMTGADVKSYMQPVQEMINKQQGTVSQMQGGYDESIGLARNMMDPMSAFNVQQRGLQQQQGAESLALQNLLARRQAASMGQDSGITASQMRSSSQQMGRDINQQHQLGLQRNYAQGLGQFNQSQGLLGNIGSMQSGIAGQQLGIQENIAQAEIARRNMDMEIQQAKKNRTSDFWGGLLGGVAGGLTNKYL